MTPELLSAVMEATWPPARQWREGPFTFRDGADGGKRVSAASCDGDWTDSDLTLVEAMAEPLVLIRATDGALDAALAVRGWRVIDPVVAYAIPVADLTADLPWLAVFPHWPPLAIARSIWGGGGIGAGRLRVMDRVTGTKTAILARQADRSAGIAFVARHGDEAMVHALEVSTPYRRKGVGETLLRAAANWVAGQGATRLSLVVTERNTAARALYARLQMQVVGHYHYRVK